ncbi:MAG: CBS domain-containing protein [Pseudobdellovibrionaceae bacterium]|nr:CBS domain-containing protein [Pseudobdellovibrionaceae bacterium]
MLLSEIMTASVEVISPFTPLQEAAEKMRVFDTGSLPICDGKKVLGMLTDRDIVVRAVAKGMHPEQTMVSDIMTEEVIYLFEDQDVSEAARLMEDRQIRRLLILNRDEELAGIVSLGDLSQYTDHKISGHVLEQVSEPGSRVVL